MSFDYFILPRKLKVENSQHKQPFFQQEKVTKERNHASQEKKEVLKTCGKIETQFPAHVTQTEIAISKLKDAELIDPKTVSYYATKLRECRERIGLTETSVGNLLNLSHVSIVGYENALRPRASIDRTYLKLFALIYDVSPLYLVGKTDNPLDYTGGVSSRKVFADNYRAYNVCTQLR